MRDFFAFRTMITGYVIQVIFVIGLILIVIGSIGAIAQDQPLIGLAVLIFGGLYWRILCEFVIVVFRMNKSLDAIRASTAGIPAALASRGSTPDAGGGGAHTEGPAPIAGPTETVSKDMPSEGWYDDAERPGRKRWWDGTAWGIRDDEHPSTATATAVEPSAEAAPASSSAPESASEPPPTRFCENCGAERSPDTRFCTSCGHA